LRNTIDGLASGWGARRSDSDYAAGVRLAIAIRLVSALLVAGPISACGSSSPSSNGVASKSPGAIISAADTAITGVKSVRVSGSIVSGGSRITLDLSLAAGKGGRGQMSENGLGFQMVVLDQTVYIDGSPAFWRHFGGAAAAQLFQGKWLKAPANGSFASVALLTNVHELFTQLLSSHGTLAKGATTTVDGQKVVAIKDTTKNATLYVATTGKPYPVEIVKTGSGGGRVLFDRFNQSVSVTAPANAIDLSKLQSG
jgi:hypothetical protein